MGYDQKLFREMIGLFQEDGPQRLKDAHQAYEQRDATRVHQAAHTLKGLAANFSAQPAVEAAAQVEQLARANQWSDLVPALARLDDALAELLTALQPLLKASSSQSTKSP
jgi:protein-histidine pros-kinase